MLVIYQNLILCNILSTLTERDQEWRSKYQEKEEEEGVQNFLNGAHQTGTDSNNILNVLCIILSAYLDIFSFTYTTSHKTDVHHKSLDMFIGVCLCTEVPGSKLLLQVIHIMRSWLYYT